LVFGCCEEKILGEMRASDVHSKRQHSKPNKSEEEPMKGFLLTLALIAVVLGGGWAMGWITFSNTENSSAIQVDKPKMESDAEKAKAATKQATDKVVEGTKQAAESIKEGTKKAVDAVKDDSQEAKENAKESLKEGAENVEDKAEDVQEDLNEKPEE
jgi:F0F1-type ATP synthase membrane subunit b/b'